MRLYVVDNFDRKIYLKSSAKTRHELAREFGSVFTVNGMACSAQNVVAEKSDIAALGMVVGGALGLFGGVPGVLLGGALGGLVGHDTDEKERKAVDAFNAS